MYIERFLSPHQGLQVLYVQAEQQAEAGRPLELPPVLQGAVEAEVTGEPKYSAYHLSLATPATIARRHTNPGPLGRGL